MSHWARVKYAFIMAVTAVGVMMIADMLLHLGIGDFIFSPVFFVPVVAVSYLLAPRLAKYIKNK